MVDENNRDRLKKLGFTDNEIDSINQKYFNAYTTYLIEKHSELIALLSMDEKIEKSDYKGILLGLVKPEDGKKNLEQFLKYQELKNNLEKLHIPMSLYAKILSSYYASHSFNAIFSNDNGYQQYEKILLLVKQQNFRLSGEVFEFLQKLNSDDKKLSDYIKKLIDKKSNLIRRKAFFFKLLKQHTKYLLKLNIKESSPPLAQILPSKRLKIDEACFLKAKGFSDEQLNSLGKKSLDRKLKCLSSNYISLKELLNKFSINESEHHQILINMVKPLRGNENIELFLKFEEWNKRLNFRFDIRTFIAILATDLSAYYFNAIFKSEKAIQNFNQFTVLDISYLLMEMPSGKPLTQAASERVSYIFLNLLGQQIKAFFYRILEHINDQMERQSYQCIVEQFPITRRRPDILDESEVPPPNKQKTSKRNVEDSVTSRATTNPNGFFNQGPGDQRLQCMEDRGGIKFAFN